MVAEQCLMPLIRFPTCGNLRQIQFDLPLNEPNWQVKRGLKITLISLLTKWKLMLIVMLKHTEMPHRDISYVFFLLKENRVKRKGNLITSIVLSEFFA